MPILKARAALHEWQGAQVFAVNFKRVIETDIHRVFGHHATGDGPAIEPLLQIIKRRDNTVTHHQQLAIEYRLEAERLGKFGKPLRDVIAAAREQPRDTTLARHLHANAVPFPFDGKIIE